MNKSMKQMADELGIDKQQVYRFITREKINEVGQDGKTRLYDETAQTLISAHFKEKYQKSKFNSETNQNVLIETFEAQIETLKKQVESLENDKIDLSSELNKEREHNRELQDKLLDTLNNLSATPLLEQQNNLADKIQSQSQPLDEEHHGFFARLKYLVKGEF